MLWPDNIWRYCYHKIRTGGFEQLPRGVHQGGISKGSGILSNGRYTCRVSTEGEEQNVKEIRYQSRGNAVYKRAAVAWAECQFLHQWWVMRGSWIWTHSKRLKMGSLQSV